MIPTNSPKNLDSLRALIDSGKRENIEMAVHLSQNLPKEWQWLHRHIKAKLDLPDRFISWLDVYSRAVKQNSDNVTIELTHLVKKKPSIIKFDPYKTDTFIFNIGDVQANVANEIFYVMHTICPNDLSDDIYRAQIAVMERWNQSDEEADQNLAISISNKVLSLKTRMDFREYLPRQVKGNRGVQIT